ncbi:MAG: VWA domain-containing protein [Clostridia bacterium]|nr:VWA domain-containing protein [Clostridia bacterium]
MLNFKLNYDHPWLLLLIIPAVLLTLIPYFRMSKKYRCTRNRIISITLHLIAMVLAINLLAGLSFSYEIPNKENEVILLVDVSHSNEKSREGKDEFVQSVLNICDDGFRVGVVKFGYGQVYSAPLTEDTDLAYEQYLLSEDPDTTATDLASALKYASTLFEHPETGKIVVLSDGVETDKTAVSVIKAIAADGIKVDTVYFPNEEQSEIQILSVNLPEQQQIVPGQTFNMEVLLRSNFGNTEQDLILKLYDNEELLGAVPVTVNKEEQKLPVALALETNGLHELRFEIEHDGDTLTQNNAYRTYINLQTFDNILLIEKNENESEKLQNLLKDQYNVTAISLEQDLEAMPRNISEMAEYEQIILVNVAYSDMPAGFEEMLNRYVYDLGGGLFTVGGVNDIINGTMVPHAYNRNDIDGSTYYKQMLPVNVVDYTPPIAVMIVVDTSASMSMGKLEAAVEGAEACLDALSDRDFCGVMSFATRASEELQVLPVSQKEKILEAIRGIDHESASGGTIYSDAIMRAGRALSVINNVERKHIIIVSDGMPGDDYDTYLPYIQDNMEQGITLSVVTIDADSTHQEQMENTASEGGGKYYNVSANSLHTLPGIMQLDLALNAIAEIEYGEEFYMTIKDHTSVTNGILESDIPPLTGYYGTVPKENAKVPLMGKYVPIYAQWKYGAGNVGSFMSDLNGNWSATFVENEVGQTIIGNIVAGLFPMQDVKADDLDYVIKTDNYTTQINVHSITENHKVAVEVTPITESVKAALKDGITVVAAEDSRRFTFEIKLPGLYQITLKELDESGNEVARTVTYETFSYSQEYNQFPDRAPLGEELMTLLSVDGKGIVVQDPAEIFQSFAKTLKRVVDPRIAFLILVIVLVLLDIAVRKFKFKWPWELVREHKQKKADQASKAQ